MMKRLLLAGASLLALAAAPPARAADLSPAYKTPPAAAPIPLYNWTGIYVGVNGGGAWGKQDPLDVITDAFDHFKISYSGGLIGGTAGAQVQVAHVVIGFEADLDWASITGHATFTPTIFGVPAPFLLNAKTSMDWMGTLRGRLGYAHDNWLFYVTGGAAVIGAKTELLTVAGPVCGTFGVINCSGTDKRIGGAAGAGVEYGFAPNWSAKLEYLYVSALSLEVSHLNMVRAGINWRFGGN
jgi:outer membrane immunogenic protein